MKTMHLKKITMIITIITMLSGCEFAKTIPVAENLSIPAGVETAEPALMLFPVDDHTGYTYDESYLGYGLDFISYLVIFPYQFMMDRYTADTTRSDAVRLAVHANLKNAGIAVVDLGSNASYQFNNLPEGELGMQFTIRTMKVDTNLSVVLPLVLFNIFMYEDYVSHIALDCQLWQAGNTVPLSSGTVDKQFDDEVQFHDALSQVVDACITQSNFKAERVILLGQRSRAYKSMMEAAAAKQASGQGEEALAMYSEAWVKGLLPQERDEAFAALARQYVFLSNKPELPEEARKFGVQAETAVRQKNHAAAVELYRNELRVAPWWPNAHYNLALILAELKRYPEAIAEMQKYLALVPNAANARQAQDKMYGWELQQ